MATLCLYHPNGPTLLPHLETLKWITNESILSILPFFSPTVKILQLGIGREGQSANDFFNATATRGSQLKHLTLRTSIGASLFEKSLQRAIYAWKSLETLRIPMYYLTPSILEATASLPNLTALHQDYWVSMPYNEAAILRQLPKDPFPKLRVFSFDSDPRNAYRLVQGHAELFARLVAIRLNAPDSVCNADVLKLVRRLGEICPQLSRLILNIRVAARSGGEISPLTVEVLEGIFPCRSLETIEIGHPFPLTITETDVQRMATAWPKLSAFRICNEPDFSLQIRNNMGNSLSILSAFAKHFPKMRVLGLFFAKHKPVQFSGDLYPEHEFHQLEELSVGLSPVPGGQAHDVAFFIASLCVEEPVLETGEREWYVGTLPAGWSSVLQQWEEASKFLEFAMRTKIAGRARVSRTAN